MLALENWFINVLLKQKLNFLRHPIDEKKDSGTMEGGGEWSGTGKEGARMGKREHESGRAESYEKRERIRETA